MKVLALTHAHLDKAGLSPVSCERADGFVYTWIMRCKWAVDIVYTKDTKWGGPWGNGIGLNANVITVSPGSLMISEGSFKYRIKSCFKEFRIGELMQMFGERVYAQLCFYFPLPKVSFLKARFWASTISKCLVDKYDFIFVSSGRGDEYLLETGFRLSKKLSIPLVIDFRDLFSAHHDAQRFTIKQRIQFKKYERKIFERTVLISTPQLQDVDLLSTYAGTSVIQVSHSYYIRPEWNNDVQEPNEFCITYTGKLYASSPGYRLFLDFVRAINLRFKRVFFQIFTDQPEAIQKDVNTKNLKNVVISSWKTPQEIWRHLRQARVVLIYNSSVGEGRSLLPTKAFISAATGNKILFLYSYFDQAVENFVQEYNCGIQVQSVDNAVKWFERNYVDTTMELKKLNELIPERLMVSYQFGLSIEKKLTEYNRGVFLKK